jgi:hypothetical protein
VFQLIFVSLIARFSAAPCISLGPVEHWDCGFESQSRRCSISAFFCVVLSCVGRGLATDRFNVQGDLPRCLNGFTVSEINS